MNLSNMIPVVGANSTGVPIMMLMTSTGSVSAPSVEVLNSTETNKSWDATTIDCIQSTPNGILATGYATTKDGQTVNVSWKYSSSWTAGLIDFASVREDSGISYSGSNFLVAAGNNVRLSSFTFAPGSVVGNINSTVYSTPNASASNFTVDNISSTGSYVVATSIGVKLVYTPIGSVAVGGTWDAYAGEPRNHVTGHLDTTYTFPGYSGGNAQIQRTVAVSNEGPYTPPTLWDTVSNNNEGFYGLTNCPHFDFEWLQ